MAFLSMSLLAAPGAAQAQLVYTTNADTTLTVAGYSGDGAVTIPASMCDLTVTGIGTNAFAGTAVTSVTMPDSIVNIMDTAFSSCGNLTTVVFSSNIANIGNAAFGDCASLASAAIPATVTNIGNFAFIYCASLKSLVIPAGVNTIGQAAFQDCADLTNVTMANGVRSLGDEAFLGCSALASITVPGSVTNIGGGAFQDCASLTNAVLSNGMTSIGVEMFDSCQQLRNVTIPVGVTNIGAYAFADAALTGVRIPYTVTSIEEGAFSGTSLRNVALSSNVANVGQNAFSICSSLTNISVSASNRFYSGVHGVLFDINQSAIIQYPAGLNGTGDYTVPAGVAQIADGAFAGCSLSNITIPASVTEIGPNVFYDAAKLNVVFFEGNPPAADPSAFESDTGVTAYYLPGATGWSSTFAGVPSLLWNPAIQTGDGNFGVRNNQFGFNITGTSNIILTLEACANLANPVWSHLSAVTLTRGSFYFRDPVGATNSARFYRIRSP